MSVTKWQQLLEGFKPLSRVALRWSNELKQIEGNLDNKHFSALRAKMAEGVTYTWLLSGRRCLIYREPGLSQCQKKDTPLMGSQLSTSDFHVERKDSKEKKHTWQRNVYLNSLFQILMRFFLLSAVTLKGQRRVEFIIEWSHGHSRKEYCKIKRTQ